MRTRERAKAVLKRTRNKLKDAKRSGDETRIAARRSQLAALTAPPEVREPATKRARA